MKSVTDAKVAVFAQGVDTSSTETKVLLCRLEPPTFPSKNWTSRFRDDQSEDGYTDRYQQALAQLICER